ncbi:MAG: aspartate/glutamate racemase family protein [Hyphomicrobiaceae bacterium]
MRIWHQSFTDLDKVPLYRRTLVDHAARVVDAGNSVTVHGLKPGTYGPDFVPIDAIRHRYLEMLNESQIVEAVLTAEREGYDAVALGCFYDPGLRAARSLVDIPVVGLSETAMLVACSLGQRFALIALNEDQKAQHEEVAHVYGLERRLAASLAMQPPIDEYMLEGDDDATAPIVEGFHAACRRALEAGAEVIIPGDGVLNEFVWRKGLMRSGKATVVDSLGLLFRYAAFMAGCRSALGLEVSRVRHYAKPSPAMLRHARRFAGIRPIGEDEFSGRGQ